MKRTVRNGVKVLLHSEIPIFRKRILQRQGGLCQICWREAKRPCLDHSHVKRLKGTGLVRGVLCSHCNVFVSKSENNCIRYGIPYKDLPDILRAMAAYLERDHLPYLHPSERPKPKRLTKRSYNKLLPSQSKAVPYILPPYPRRGRMTKKLARCFELAGIEPEYYR